MSGAPGRGSASRASSRLELDERWARAAWAFLTEPRDHDVTTLLAECGAVEALVRLRAGRLSTRNGCDVRLPELDLDGLAARGFTVVSGAAYGVDSAAHRAALAAGGPTVAVLACGADRAYPTAHRAMLDQVAGVGAVVSEVPLGCAP